MLCSPLIGRCVVLSSGQFVVLSSDWSLFHTVIPHFSLYCFFRGVSRWLQGLAVAQPGEICPDSALHGTGAAVSLGGLTNPEAGKAGTATVTHSSLLAGVALEVETFVRG